MTPPPPGMLPSRRTAMLVVAGAVTVTLLNFWYRYMDVLARGEDEPFQVKLIEEATGVFGAVVLLVPVIWFTRHLRWRGLSRPRQLLLHIPVLFAFAGLHTALLWASRSVLFPVAGLGFYDYGEMPLRFAMELGIQIPIYVLCVGGTLAVERIRESRAGELRLARLQGELARARLVNLEHQLRPHFLFNALNTISSVMYEDRERADGILSDLALFLRRSMHFSEAQQVPLREEIENLEIFLRIARARFEERLDVQIDVEPETMDAQVPTLLLQPLVENALRHGDPGEERPLRIRVDASVRSGWVVLEVRDNGPGADAPLDELAKRGVGLGTTVRRLQLLHPDNHRVEGVNLAQGGYRVRIELPFDPASHSTEPTAAEAAP